MEIEIKTEDVLFQVVLPEMVMAATTFSLEHSQSCRSIDRGKAAAIITKLSPEGDTSGDKRYDKMADGGTADDHYVGGKRGRLRWKKNSV